MSDHSSVLLDGGGMQKGPTPFRFENMWLNGFFGNVVGTLSRMK